MLYVIFTTLRWNPGGKEIYINSYKKRFLHSYGYGYTITCAHESIFTLFFWCHNNSVLRANKFGNNKVVMSG